jgi:hypothetical protein
MQNRPVILFFYKTVYTLLCAATARYSRKERSLRCAVAINELMSFEQAVELSRALHHSFLHRPDRLRAGQRALAGAPPLEKDPSEKVLRR